MIQVEPLGDEEWSEAQNDLAILTAVLLRLPLDRFLLRAEDALEHLGEPPADDRAAVNWRTVNVGLRTVIRTAKAAKVCQTELQTIYDDAMRAANDDRRAPDPNKL